MSDQKKSLIFYYEWLPLINSLPDDSRLKFYDIIHNPGKRIAEVKEPHLKAIIDYVLLKVKDNENKYQAIVEERKKAGAIGGKQKLANASKKKQKVAKLADNVNENENENGNVNENDNVNENAFNIFWDNYPLRLQPSGSQTRGSKKEAEQVWEKIDPKYHGQIIHAAKQCTKDTNPKYVKDAFRWLYNEEYKAYKLPEKAPRPKRRCEIKWLNYSERIEEFKEKTDDEIKGLITQWEREYANQ